MLWWGMLNVNVLVGNVNALVGNVNALVVNVNALVGIFGTEVGRGE